jgi:hypothetical protein
VRLERIASVNISDFYASDGGVKDIATLPDRLAPSARSSLAAMIGQSASACMTSLPRSPC